MNVLNRDFPVSMPESPQHENGSQKIQEFNVLRSVNWNFWLLESAFEIMA